MAGRIVLVDTSVLVAASVTGHPAHEPSLHYMDNRAAEGDAFCISPQICREFVGTMTRGPAVGETFDAASAIDAIDRWRADCTLLLETSHTVDACLRLARMHAVRGKSIHDCNIVAVMQVYGVRVLATRNPSDFKRYGVAIDAVGSEAP